MPTSRSTCSTAQLANWKVYGSSGEFTSLAAARGIKPPLLQTSILAKIRLMSLFARLMYTALVWKERQRARRNQSRNQTLGPEHLETGERGETMAYWFLRQAGYTIVARNRRSRGGELDLVGWDGPVLAFIEVKTRASGEAARPEDSVTRKKQRRIGRAAREFLARLQKKPEAHRFDIVSVSWDDKAGLQVRLTKDAFKP